MGGTEWEEDGGGRKKGDAQNQKEARAGVVKNERKVEGGRGRAPNGREAAHACKSDELKAVGVPDKVKVKSSALPLRAKVSRCEARMVGACLSTLNMSILPDELKIDTGW